MSTAFLITDFDENFYIGYPHSNGFADGGNSLILGQRDAAEVSLWKMDLASRQRQELCRFARASLPEKVLWPDVAFEANRLVTIADNAVWIIDLNAPHAPKEVYRAPAGCTVHPLPSIRADGSRIVCGLQKLAPDSATATPQLAGGAVHPAKPWWQNRFASISALQIDPDSGRTEVLFEKAWWANHFHYSPFDPNWVGFCHEGLCSIVMDRVWGWHAQDAPEGRQLFDQKENDPATTLFAGHERWSFHDHSVLIIAYGEGPGTPRGIYEAFADGRPQRLVSEGERDMHLDISRDGRWVVADTSGPHDLPGKGWEDANNVSDIIFLDYQTGERRFAARSRITNHPSHPHPVFNPDGTHVYFNEAEAGGDRNRVWCVPNPFLA